MCFTLDQVNVTLALLESLLNKKRLIYTLQGMVEVFGRLEVTFNLFYFFKVSCNAKDFLEEHTRYNKI